MKETAVAFPAKRTRRTLTPVEKARDLQAKVQSLPLDVKLQFLEALKSEVDSERKAAIQELEDKLKSLKLDNTPVN